MNSTRGQGEAGQFVPLMTVVVLLVVGVIWVLVQIGVVLRDRSQADLAADAAALAGVVGGPSEASRLAEANGAILLDFRVDGTEVWVEVRVGRSTSSARAGWQEGWDH